MSTREKQAELAAKLKAWQRIENTAISQTAQVMERTENPVIRAIMEIIQRDSNMHYRIQGLLIDALQQEAPILTPEELTDVWSQIERHIETEKKTREYLHDCMELQKATGNVIVYYLLSYLEKDERKHDDLLDGLAGIKKGMYP